MLIPSETLERIASGEVSLAFRRWRRPTVRTGGTLLTKAGQLEIRSVSVVGEAEITDTDARRAGFSSRAALLKELHRRPTGDIHRIEFGELRPDPRIALRETRPAAAEVEEILQRLERLDRFAGAPWTRSFLSAIRDHPALRAADLAPPLGFEKPELKRRIRKLKSLGLTISLEAGYRLSPRGEVLLAALEKPA